LLTRLLVKDPAGRPSHDAIHAMLTAAYPVAPAPMACTWPRPAADPLGADGAATSAWPAPAEETLGAADGCTAAS
jgi:hypothetical protein